MKKIIIALLCIVLLGMMTAFVACQPAQQPTQAAIRLRSEAQQQLKVGETVNLVYSVVGSNSEVVATSSNEDVVVAQSVFDYIKVEAVGVGSAEVTLSLKDNPDITAKVEFTITRNFFMTQNDYRNGSLDLNGQETGSAVYVKDGQAQLLVDACGEVWYFSVHIDHMGFTGGDNGGAWGVGSFWVDAVHPIGDTMYWYAFRNAGDNAVKLYNSGWRYEAGLNTSKESLASDTVIDTTNGVDITIIRDGISHYIIVDDGTNIVKDRFDVPYFEGQETFPGVFGQNQVLTITNYKASNNVEEVYKVLETFQVAESIEINAVDDRIVAGRTYNLTTTVLPEITFNKNVTYTLKEDVEGVTLSADGVVSATADAVGKSFTVIATALSDSSVTDEFTFTVVADPQTQEEVFDSELVVGNATLQDNTVSANGTTYIPFNQQFAADRWYVSVNITNNTPFADIDKSVVGLMASDNGYMNYYFFAVAYSKDVTCPVIYGAMGEDNSIANGVDGPLSGATVTNISLLKDGNELLIFAGDKMYKRIIMSAGTFFPVIYTQSATATIEVVEASTDDAVVDSKLDEHPFFVGSYVDKQGDSYIIASHDFGEADNMNWPPDNDYINGLKLATLLNSNFTVQFTMSDIKPYVLGNGDIDSKILVYLKSERTTCSLQFVIKKNASTGGKTVYSFVANLDDATWEEYLLPSGIDISSGNVDIRIVRNDTNVQLFINGTECFQGEAFMQNNGEWNQSTVATPGIGTFRCGVTITNPTISLNN